MRNANPSPTILLALFAALLPQWLPGPATAAPPEDDARFLRSSLYYQNLGSTGYERYPRFPETRPVYGRTGQYVGHGQYLMRWDEIRERYIDEKLDSGLSILDTRANSILYDDQNELRPFGGLALVQQSLRGRGTSFFMGSGPITTFSSLVFYRPDFAGTRVDFSMPRSDFSFILSRGGVSDRGFAKFVGTTSGVVTSSPVLLYGANWRGHFGVLQLGSTFLRQIQSDLRGEKKTLIRGDVPYAHLQQPKSIKVRFEDDAPRDGAGMAVRRVDVILRDAEGQVYTSAAGTPGEDAMFRADLLPTVVGSQQGGRYVARGPGEAVDFTFAIPADVAVESIEFVAVVSGDYRIGIRQIHDYLDERSGQVEEKSWPTPPPLNVQYSRDFKDIPYTPEPFYTVLRAEGSPGRDTEKVVRFHHQIPTGQTFYGINARIESRSLFFDAELVANPQDFMFPKKGGHREREGSYAGFVRLKGTLGRVGSLGGELFRLEPTYGGWYDSRRGGAVFFTDMVGEASSGEDAKLESATQEFPLYADNDDHDLRPDELWGDYANVPTDQFDNVQVLGAGAPESGVYPGLDMDRDFVLDIDVNRNGVGDWFEPFFAYDTDPPEFVYDVDFNNNGVPDFRENDAEPDYPYRRDQTGVHVVFDVHRRPRGLDRLALGWYRVQQIAGRGESRTLYARAEGHASLGGVSLALYDDVKRVQDDLRDDVYHFVLTSDLSLASYYNTARRLPPPDPLIMRNSVVNTAFLSTRYEPLPNLEVVNNFRHVLNLQRAVEEGGTPIQDDDALHNFSMVNKVQWTTRPLDNVSLTARLKHLLVQWDAGSYYRRSVATVAADTLSPNPEASWSMLTPSLRARWRLTPRTSIEFGQAGFFLPALRSRYTDRQEETRNYTMNMTVLQATMRGVHQGYLITTNVGVRRELTDHTRASGIPDDEFSALFIDVVFGLE